MKPRVLVTRYLFPDAIAVLTEYAELTYNDSHDIMSPDALQEAIKGKQAVMSQITETIDARLMDAAPGLKVISNVAVGFDNIDVAAATARGIAVTNTPGILTETTADFAFALMMATSRRISEAERYVRAGKWIQWEIDQFSGYDVHGRTLGIIGMGRIGQGMARRASGFGMRVLYHDVTRVPPAEEATLGIEFVYKETILRTSDFISLHLPLSAQTTHYIGAHELALMKGTAILINTARGQIVDENALAEALAEKQIAGAGLDVFENEPTVHPGLLQLDNAVTVPHMASSSIATRTGMAVMAARNVLAILKGETPVHVVNPDYVEYRT